MTELRQLTGARGIAAWVVVLYHLRQSIAGLPSWAEAVLAKGYLAVDFFFLLSGFVIWLTWHDRLHRGDATTVARFLQKRVARVWPLHLAMLGGAVALASVLLATGRHDPAFPFGELPLHVLLVQNWGFTPDLRWNDPAWSISCELAAYLLFPLLGRFSDWRALSTAALVVLAGLFLLAIHIAMMSEPTLGADIPRYGLLRCLGEFVTGTIIAALWLRGAGRGALPIAAALAVAWALGAAETLVVPAVLAALLLALARSPGWLGRPAIHWLGEISYATYLSHFLLWKVVKLVAVSSDQASLATVAFYLMLVLAASAGLYYGLERPAQRLVNARPLRLRRSPRLALPSVPR